MLPPSKTYDMNALPTEREAIEDMLVEVQSEIDDITAQLEEYDDTDVMWVKRAEGARRIRFTVRAKLERRLKRLDAPDLIAVQYAKAEATAANLERQASIVAMAASARAARVEASNDRERQRFMLLKEWLKAHHPDVWAEGIAFLNSLGE